MKTRLGRCLRGWRLGLCLAGLVVAGVLAARLTLRAEEPGEFPWPFHIGAQSPEPQPFSFPAALAAAEAETGMDLQIVGPGGAWGEVASQGCPYLVPLGFFGGAQPPPQIPLAVWCVLSMGGYAQVTASQQTPGWFAGTMGGFAVYVPGAPVLAQWGSQQAPDPALSAGLAACFLGGGGFLGNAYAHVFSPGVPGQPLIDNAVSSWKIEGLIRYVPTAPPNQPPTAKASADKTVILVGQPVQFQGDQSTDPENQGLTYWWDFGDGTFSDQANPSHTYTEPKIYTVRLTVHDPQSAEDTAEVTVLVMRVDRLTIEPAAVTLFTGETQQFKVTGTWYGPDNQPDTADDVRADVTGLVSWRIEPREAGEPAPGTVTATGLFTAGTPPAGAGRRLRGFIVAYVEYGAEARAEVDVWEPKVSLEWKEPDRYAQFRKIAVVGESCHLEAEVLCFTTGYDGRPWDFSKQGLLNYYWVAQNLTDKNIRITQVQLAQGRNPAIDMVFPAPGAYQVTVQAELPGGLLAQAAPPVTVDVPEIQKAPGGTSDYARITDKNMNVLPGQCIKLKVVFSGPRPKAPKFTWTLPGKTFKEYEAKENSAVLIPLYRGDRSQEDVQFYWADSGDQREVKCEIGTGAEVKKVTAILNVKAPRCEFEVPTMGEVTTRGTGKDLRLGLYPKGGAKKGILWSGMVYMPAGFEKGKGAWHYVQVLKPGRVRNFEEANPRYVYRYGQWVLDTSYPYQPFKEDSTGSWPTDDAEKPLAGDTPDLSLEAVPKLKTIQVHECFQTYIMFLPPGEDSRYVPLKKVEWEWGALATLNLGDKWVISKEVPAPGAPVPIAVDTSDHPTWQSNVEYWGLPTYNSGPITLTIGAVGKNDSASRIVPSIPEGGKVQGTVSTVDPVTHDTAIELSMARRWSGLLSFPLTVTIPRGSRSTNFEIKAADTGGKAPPRYVEVIAQEKQRSGNYDSDLEGVFVIEKE